MLSVVLLEGQRRYQIPLELELWVSCEPVARLLGAEQLSFTRGGCNLNL